MRMAMMQNTTQFQIQISYPSDENQSLNDGLMSVRIINSMKNPWPIIKLNFILDNQAIIESFINGTETLELKIYYVGEDGEPKDEPVTFELLFLENNLDLPPKVADNLTDPRETKRTSFQLTCIPKPAYLTMTAFINKLWEEEANLRPIDFLYEIFDLREIDRTMISEEGVNENVINQLLVPPMTVKSAIDYIDEKFGIYHGPLFRYCNYSGQILLWDLSKKYELQKPEGFTFHHKLPSFSRDEELFTKVNDEVILEPNIFLTYDGVETLNYPNSFLFKNGYNITQIIHPHEDIAYFQKKTFDEIQEKYGFWHDVPEVKYNPAFKNRKIYYTDTKGFETGDSYSGQYDDSNFTGKLASDFMDLASIKFSFYRNIKIHYCMKVGETLYLKPHSEHEKDIEGMNFEGCYMVETSDILIVKTPQNANCQCTLTAFRSRMSKD